MKVLVDESVAADIIAVLKEWDFDVKVLAQAYPDTLSDEEVLAIAQEEERHLVTADPDFEKLIDERGLPRISLVYLNAFGGAFFGDD
jgi:predicted nuclease of predicted toxin-antitoxin system